MRQLILPSLMCKSPQELRNDFKKLKGVAKELHLDIVDSQFAPNKTFHFDFKLSPDFVYNVHLMINDPQKWVDKHGTKVQTIIFHPEVLMGKKIIELIKKIKNKKKRVGLALNPETKVSKIKKYLPLLDYVLILTVHPGFYGAKYLSEPLKKIKLIKKINKKIKVIVDGGMSPKTIGQAARAGADLFVSGSYTTKAEDPKQSIKNLMGAIKA